MSSTPDNKEVEVRFLEIDKEALIKKLRDLGAKDLGEDLLQEVIIYDKEFTWRDGGKSLLRLRTRNNKTELTFKHRNSHAIGDTEEIEFEVSDKDKAELLLNRLGFVSFRHQEKKRHTFELNNVVVDIDTWPRVPTYVELEGQSEEDLRKIAALLDLDWNKAVLENPRVVIEKYYKIPVGTMRYFTFDKFE
ncbi:MAG: class IV adenylate cyclase [bacterium]